MTQAEFGYEVIEKRLLRRGIKFKVEPTEEGERKLREVWDCSGYGPENTIIDFNPELKLVGFNYWDAEWNYSVFLEHGIERVIYHNDPFKGPFIHARRRIFLEQGWVFE